jgi:hypothetical protein
MITGLQKGEIKDEKPCNSRWRIWWNEDSE